MKKLLLVIALMFSVTGFSQKTEKESFQNQKTAKERLLECKTQILKNRDDLQGKALPAKGYTSMPKGIKQCLDSIVAPEHFKRSFAYDSRGNLTLNALCYWDSENNDWRVNEKEEWAYDANGNWVMWAYYCRKHEHILQGTYKWEATYDTNGRETVCTEYNWDEENNDWKGHRNKERIYDANGNETLIVYIWDNENNDWREYYKVEVMYDDNENPTMIIAYTWDSENNDWAGSEKIEYMYDAGEIILALLSLWENNAWKEYMKVEIT